MLPTFLSTLIMAFGWELGRVDCTYSSHLLLIETNAFIIVYSSVVHGWWRGNIEYLTFLRWMRVPKGKFCLIHISLYIEFKFRLFEVFDSINMNALHTYIKHKMMCRKHSSFYEDQCRSVASFDSQIFIEFFGYFRPKWRNTISESRGKWIKFTC